MGVRDMARNDVRPRFINDCFLETGDNCLPLPRHYRHYPNAKDFFIFDG